MTMVSSWRIPGVLMLAFVLVAPLIAAALAPPSRLSPTCHTMSARSNRSSWHVWIDFDQTLTTHDTISTLGESTRHPSWPQVVTAYLADYDAAAAAAATGQPVAWPADPFGLDAQLPTGVAADRWAYQPAADWAAQHPQAAAAMQVVQGEIQDTLVAEFRSLARINHVGIFSQTTPAEFAAWGTSKVPLLSGALAALHTLTRYAHVHVCSVNWSTHWIHGALQAVLPLTAIVASDTRAGEIDARVVTGIDKVRLLSQAVPTGAKSVFIGDSLHDLLAMLWAHVGVLVVGTGGTPTASVARVLERARVHLVPLREYEEAQHDGPVVYVTSAWSEIEQVLGERVLQA